VSGGISFGSLDGALKQYPEGAGIFGSAGPVSDGFIMARNKVDLICGPVGSGKTTAAVKRALVRAQRQPPLRSDPGVRRYVLAVWRETYDQLWRTTIKSWQKVLDPQKGIGSFTGSYPRPAEHRIVFDDAFGKVELTAVFTAFGEGADVEDLGGAEYTDAYLNEMNTLRRDLFINLFGRVGRNPNRGEVGLPDDESLIYGRIFGDCNAPDPLNWVYTDFFSPKRTPGFVLHRQPGGLDEGAENIKAVGRAYYRQMVGANADKPWWVKIKVHNRPGFNRESDVVFGKYDDDEMAAPEPLEVFRTMPVVVGIDGGFTPAAAFTQAPADGQFRIVDEVAIERGDESDLGQALLAKMALPRYRGCQFVFVSDPATGAGEDLPLGSFRSRLADLLGHDVELAASNDLQKRIADLSKPMERGKRGFVIDAVHCPTIRRALNGTYQYRNTRGTLERSSVIKTPDSHALEAAQYAASLSGTAKARMRKDQSAAARRKVREQERSAPRYSALKRR